MVEYTSLLQDTVQNAFNAYAKGGKVDVKKQLAMLVRAVGLNPTNKQVKKWEKEAGSSLDESAFKAFCKKKFEESDDNLYQIQDAFCVFDQGGDGFISVAEFKHIMTTMGEPLSGKELSEVLKDCDAKDGKIDYNTFAEEVFGEA